jgi:RIO-like serine/threonine protein kinase
LKSIHCAGVLHGDIREHNLLVGNAEVTIIDFDQSTRCDDQEAMDRETAELRYILDGGSESEDE